MDRTCTNIVDSSGRRHDNASKNIEQHRDPNGYRARGGISKLRCITSAHVRMKVISVTLAKKGGETELIIPVATVIVPGRACRSNEDVAKYMAGYQRDPEYKLTVRCRVLGERVDV
jgi:hypothetical protein